jgi:hypothetical protein
MKEITEQEMIRKIEEVSTNFKGQLDDLQAAVGMLVVGRLFGWKVMRLVSSRRHWTVACKLFGDLKELLPDRGLLVHKSVGLELVDKAGDYWGIIKGEVSREALPAHERRKVS